MSCTSEDLDAPVPPMIPIVSPERMCRSMFCSTGLPYPNNPTGAITEKEDLEAIAEVIRKHDIYVMTDEIYSELTYQMDHVSIASLPGMKGRTVYINGFSKAFAMTGWRLGYACAPEVILKQVINFFSFAIYQ